MGTRLADLEKDKEERARGREGLKEFYEEGAKFLRQMDWSRVHSIKNTHLCGRIIVLKLSYPTEALEAPYDLLAIAIVQATHFGKFAHLDIALRTPVLLGQQTKNFQSGDLTGV
jgi:hypothetical protein